MESKDTVTVIPGSTGITRPIPMNQFCEMWEIMKNDIRSERYVNKRKRYHDYWNPSYINTLIDHVVQDQCME